MFTKAYILSGPVGLLVAAVVEQVLAIGVFAFQAYMPRLATIYRESGHGTDYSSRNKIENFCCQIKGVIIK